MRKTENNYAFIDSQNLHIGIVKLGWKLDYYKFRIYLQEVYSVTQAFVFIGFVASNEKLYQKLNEAGFNLIFKPVVTKTTGEIKGNVDADLVLKTMIEINSFDAAVIVSSDGDFYSLVGHLYLNKKLKVVLSPDFSNCSALLKITAKGQIAFIHDLRDRLEYK